MSARFNPPIFICSRDRVSCLRRLVDWLEQAGHERIVIVDNASTYEPLLDYLDGSPHQVVRLAENHGKRALWRAGLAPSDWFVYTDPDILPMDDCPLDAVEQLRSALDRSLTRRWGWDCTLVIFRLGLTRGSLRGSAGRSSAVRVSHRTFTCRRWTRRSRVPPGWRVHVYGDAASRAVRGAASRLVRGG